MRKSLAVGKGAFGFMLLAVATFNHISARAGETSLDEGLRAYQRGAFDEAASKWQKAAEDYRREHNAPGEIKARTQLASAYQALGQQKRAVQILEEAAEIADKSGDTKSRTLAKS